MFLGCVVRGGGRTIVCVAGKVRLLGGGRFLRARNSRFSYRRVLANVSSLFALAWWNLAGVR